MKTAVGRELEARIKGAEGENKEQGSGSAAGGGTGESVVCGVERGWRASRGEESRLGRRIAAHLVWSGVARR
jgi:hypothetical protein